jgi:hypothetical protein
MRPKGCQALELFSMNLFSNSAQRMEELITKSKKLRPGATLEEAEIELEADGVRNNFQAVP